MSTTMDTITTEDKCWITEMIEFAPVMDTFILVKDGLVTRILITTVVLEIVCSLKNLLYYNLKRILKINETKKNGT